jgi:hypothetical protein
LKTTTSSGPCHRSASRWTLGASLAFGLILPACGSQSSKWDPLVRSQANLAAAMDEAEAARSSIPAGDQLEPGFIAFALARGEDAYLGRRVGTPDSIEEAALAVLLASARDAEQDLQDALQGVSDTTDQKRQMRAAVERASSAAGDLRATLRDEFDALAPALAADPVVVSGSVPVSLAQAGQRPVRALTDVVTAGDASFGVGCPTNATCGVVVVDLTTGDPIVTASGTVSVQAVHTFDRPTPVSVELSVQGSPVYAWIDATLDMNYHRKGSAPIHPGDTALGAVQTLRTDLEQAIQDLQAETDTLVQQHGNDPAVSPDALAAATAVAVSSTDQSAPVFHCLAQNACTVADVLLAAELSQKSSDVGGELGAALDRMSIAFGTLSSLMKKLEDTEQSIVGNLK